MRHRKVGDEEADETGRRIGNGRPASAVVPAVGVAADREAAPLTLAGVQRVAGNRAAAELVASDGVSARAAGGIVRANASGGRGFVMALIGLILGGLAFLSLFVGAGTLW